MAVRGQELITDSTGTTLFGPQVPNTPCILQNRGANTAYGTSDRTTASTEGFTLAAGESVNTKDLTGSWLYGDFKFICASGETATIQWSVT